MQKSLNRIPLNYVLTQDLLAISPFEKYLRNFFFLVSCYELQLNNCSTKQFHRSVAVKSNITGQKRSNGFLNSEEPFPRWHLYGYDQERLFPLRNTEVCQSASFTCASPFDQNFKPCVLHHSEMAKGILHWPQCYPPHMNKICWIS